MDLSISSRIYPPAIRRTLAITERFLNLPGALFQSISAVQWMHKAQGERRMPAVELLSLFASVPVEERMLFHGPVSVGMLHRFSQILESFGWCGELKVRLITRGIGEGSSTAENTHPSQTLRGVINHELLTHHTNQNGKIDSRCFEPYVPVRSVTQGPKQTRRCFTICQFHSQLPGIGSLK